MEGIVQVSGKAITRYLCQKLIRRCGWKNIVRCQEKLLAAAEGRTEGGGGEAEGLRRRLIPQGFIKTGAHALARNRAGEERHGASDELDALR